MPLSVTVEEKGKGLFTLKPQGMIDAVTHSILESKVDEIIQMSPRLIIFDMRDVSYISSAGITVFLLAETRLNQIGAGAFMVHLQPQVKKVFDIVQALPAEKIFSSVEEMDTYLSEIQRKVRDGEIE